MIAPVHLPVLLEETVKALAVQSGGRYIDCTVGGGGHAAAILERSSPGGQLLGLDVDPEAITTAKARLEVYSDSMMLVNENFVDLQAVCYRYDFLPVHGILFDLGLSSLQLSSDDRGFSFQREAPLDMRFSANQTLTAADIVNTYPEAELANLIKTYGEESNSRRIARNIVQNRPLRNTLELVRIIEQVAAGRRKGIHPATKTFQALRIAVNQELENLELVLKRAVSLLGFRGRLVVISYHSLEDRIVKQFMQRESKGCICPPEIPICVCGHIATLKLVTKKVITPSPLEVQINPRSRSARLRVAERVTNEEEYNVVEGLCSATEVKANVWRKPFLLNRIKRVYRAA